MELKKLGAVTLLAAWSLVLVWCTTEKAEKTEIANPASVYCEENWWKLELVDWNWICYFDDWSYCEEWAYKRGECDKWSLIESWEIVEETILSEDLLTVEDIEKLEENNFPKGYTYSVYNSETEKSSTWDYTYPEDLSHTLLIPIHATMANREVESSWIEDGMIYTLTKVTLQDSTEVSVLYITDPDTNNFVAATVENGPEITNYQFVY